MHHVNLIEYLLGFVVSDPHTFMFDSYASMSQFIGAILVTLLFVVIALAVRSHYKKIGIDKAVVPSGKIGLVNLMEFAIGSLEDFAVGIIGPHHGPKFAPLIITIFMFILFMNLLGNIPGMPAASANISLNAGMAVFVFLTYNFYGFKEHGFGYIKHFMGPVIWLAPLMFAIEIVSHFVRPASLSIRLFGNINGDHIAVGIFSGMVPVLIPAIFMALGLFVAFIQALVFSMLSAVYIQLATSHEEH